MLNYDSRPVAGEPLEVVAKPSLYARTLQTAANVLGGERALARYLRVPLPELFVWMRPGAEPPPLALFLKAVDVILNDLDPGDEKRAQQVRVAAHHKNWDNVT